MNFLLGVGRFWESGHTGVAGVALEFGVWLEKTVILKCAGLCQVFRCGCLVVCRKLMDLLVIFCGFSAEFCDKTELGAGFDDYFAGWKRGSVVI